MRRLAKRRRKDRCFALAVALLSVAFAGVGFAAPVAGAVEPMGAAPTRRVQLLQSSMTSPRARRCLTRIREELAAGGFDVVISEFGADNDALWTPESRSARDSLATITLVGNPDDGPAELWIVDGAAGGRAAIRRLSLPAGAGTHEEEVLAVRTLEFLRARALELARASAPPPPPPPPSPAASAAPVAPALATPPQRAPAPPDASAATARMAFELGACVVKSSPSLGPAYAPLLGLRAALLSVLEVRLRVAAFGSRPEVTSRQGGAAVRQDFGLLEVRTVLRPGKIVRPSVGVGGGALLVRVEGAGNVAYDGLRGEQWVGLVDAGAGLAIALGRRLALSVEAHAQLATPYPAIQFVGMDTAHLGRPTFLGAVTLLTPLGGVL